VAGAGFVEVTVFFGTLVEVCPFGVTVKPALCSRWIAGPTCWPTTSGTWTRTTRGPLEMLRITVEPLLSFVPADGSVLTTVPGLRCELTSWSSAT
jgi:hypothetical protein